MVHDVFLSAYLLACVIKYRRSLGIQDARPAFVHDKGVGIGGGPEVPENRCLMYGDQDCHGLAMFPHDPRPPTSFPLSSVCNSCPHEIMFMFLNGCA